MPLLWTCRDCGIEVLAADPVLVTTIGWTGLDGNTGRCAPCSLLEDDPSLHPLSEPSNALVRRARVAADLGRSRRTRTRPK
jgi:hypothetical protein